MAGRLLWVAVAATVVQGCLLPQDDQVLPRELPPFRNTSPRWVLGSEKPDQKGATINLGNNCPTDDLFHLTVIDPDEDTIRSKWFVDPDKAFTTPSTEGDELSDRVVRPAKSQFYAQNSRLALPDSMGRNQHTVTVVIGDREFLPAGIRLRLESFPGPDGGTIKEESEPVTFTWDVFTDPTTPCP